MVTMDTSIQHHRKAPWFLYSHDLCNCILQYSGCTCMGLRTARPLILSFSSWPLPDFNAAGGYLIYFQHKRDQKFMVCFFILITHKLPEAENPLGYAC